ncbi:MAG: hypothetical protein RLZZ373_3196 [Pseudomonadota bacterium]|jgi:hypothetical protein
MNQKFSTAIALAVAALLAACSPAAQKPDVAQTAPAAASAPAAPTEDEARAMVASERMAEEARLEAAEEAKITELVRGMNGVWKYDASGEVLTIFSGKSGVNIHTSGRVFATTLDSVDLENMVVNLSTSTPNPGDIITLKRVPAADGKTYHISAAMPNGAVFELSFIRRPTSSDIAKTVSRGGQQMVAAAAMQGEEVARPETQPASAEAQVR